MVIVIMLGPGGVQLKIAGLVVRFLEKYICAYTSILQLAIVFNRGRGDIHVNAANVPVFVMHGVYGLYAVQYILYWVVHWVLARFYGKALMAHVLKSNDLVPYFLLSELFAGNVLVLHVIRTVHAAVHAVIRKIQRREHDYSVAVECKLYFVCQLIHFLYFFGDVARKQHARFPVGKSRAGNAGAVLLGPRLFKQRVNKFYVVLVGVCVRYCFAYFGVVYKFLRLHGFGIVDCHKSFLSCTQNILCIQIFFISPRSVTTLKPIDCIRAARLALHCADSSPVQILFS